jgi:iron complex outermembrane receptor protein
MYRPHESKLPGCAFAVLLGGAVPAHAQDDGTAVLEEVVITSQRRTESLQSVPVAVSALGTEQLQEAGVQTFTDLQAVTPSLAVVDGPGGRYINIRGVGISVGTPFQTAGVPLHLDGMYVTRSELFIRDAYYDLERVELYRGPQGTFAGQNSTGGAIFLVANQPNFDGFSGNVQQTLGNYEWFQTQGAFNLPISEKWAARVALNWERRDSFTQNLGPQGSGFGSFAPILDGEALEPGNLNRRSFRGIVRYKPSDRFDMRLRYDFVNDETDGDANPRATPGTFNDPDAVLSPRTISLDFPTYSNTSVHRAILNLEWRFSDSMLMKSVSGHQALESHAGIDTDGTSPYVASPFLPPASPFPAQSFGVLRTRDDYWFQEFDLVSTTDGPLQWVAGIVGLTQHTPIFNTAGNYSVGNCTPAATPANPTPAPCTTFHILTPANPGNWLQYNQKHESAAAFGEVTYNFNDAFQLIVGGRYTYDSIELKEGSSVRSALPPNPLLNSCGGPCNVYGIGEFEKATGRVAFNWFPGGSKDTTVYLSYNQGFKPGGYQTQFTLGAAGPQPPYKEETLKNHELGVKTEMFGGRVRTNLTGFFGEYQNYQASFRIPGQQIPRSQNMPESEIYGGEVEVQGVFGDFHFNVNAGYTHTEITDGQLVVIPNNNFGAGNPTAPAGTPTCVQVGGVLPCIVTNGLPLNYAPEWTYNASIEYDFRFGDATLTPRLQYSFIDDQWVQLFHASQDLIPGHDLLDFRLTYRPRENWRIEGFVTNLTDELYVAGQAGGPINTPYLNSLSLGAPRQYGARIQFDF